MDNKRKVLELIKKYKHEIIAAIIIILFPFAIEYIIRCGWYRKYSFSNEEWFSFMGDYLGSAATVIVMYITFKKNDNDNKKQLNFQLKKQCIEFQKESIKKFCEVLLLTNYTFSNRKHIVDDVNRYSKSLHSLGLSIIFTRHDEYGTVERDVLIDELLILQKEQNEVLEKYAASLLENGSSRTYHDRIDNMLYLGCELKKVVNNKRVTIELLLNEYLKSVTKDIYKIDE